MRPKKHKTTGSNDLWLWPQRRMPSRVDCRRYLLRLGNAKGRKFDTSAASRSDSWRRPWCRPLLDTSFSVETGTAAASTGRCRPCRLGREHAVRRNAVLDPFSSAVIGSKPASVMQAKVIGNTATSRLLDGGVVVERVLRRDDRIREMCFPRLHVAGGC